MILNFLLVYTIIYALTVVGWVTALKKLKAIYFIYAFIYGIVTYIVSSIFSFLYLLINKIYHLFIMKGYLPASINEFHAMEPVNAGIYLVLLIVAIPLMAFAVFMSLSITYYSAPRAIILYLAQGRIAKQEVESAIVNTLWLYVLFALVAGLSAWYFGITL